MPSISASHNPATVAEILGLGTLADGEPGMEPKLLRDIYRYARNENKNRQLFQHNLTFARGWIDLSAPDIAVLIGAIVPLDEDRGLHKSRMIAARNLQAQSWNDVLGIDWPPIKCCVKIHGRRWGLRFQSLEPTLKGREILNEDLPPIPESH